MAPIAEAHRRPLDPAEYGGMVERTRALVAAHVPAGATVAVVSRGDDALLALEGRRGWHFPRAAGGNYAGHHPADSTAAITHLEELRACGVRHLVLPASARWWLDHYELFAEHLAVHYEVLADDPACTIFSLGAPVAEQAGGAAPADPLLLGRLRSFLDALLPERCHVLVAGCPCEELALDPRAVAPLPAQPDEGAWEAFDQLEALRRTGEAAYLVVPLAGERPAWLPDLLGAVERRQGALARRERLAAVFDIQAAAPTNGRVTA